MSTQIAEFPEAPEGSVLVIAPKTGHVIGTLLATDEGAEMMQRAGYIVW